MKKIPAWLILSAVFGALRWAVLAPTPTATTQVHLLLSIESCCMFLYAQCAIDR